MSTEDNAKADTTEKEEKKVDTGDTKKKKTRIRVLKWNAVALWSYNVQTDVCAICRNKIHELC